MNTHTSKSIRRGIAAVVAVPLFLAPTAAIANDDLDGAGEDVTTSEEEVNSEGGNTPEETPAPPVVETPTEEPSSDPAPDPAPVPDPQPEPEVTTPEEPEVVENPTPVEPEPTENESETPAETPSEETEPTDDTSTPPADNGNETGSETTPVEDEEEVEPPVVTPPTPIVNFDTIWLSADETSKTFSPLNNDIIDSTLLEGATVEIYSYEGSASVVVNPDNSVTYTRGLDSSVTSERVYYQVKLSDGSYSDGTWIDVNLELPAGPYDDRTEPVAVNDTDTLPWSQNSVTISPLSNDTVDALDAEDARIFFVSAQTDEGFTLNGDNTVTYTRTSGAVGTATATYFIETPGDRLSVNATITVTLEKKPLVTPVAVSDKFELSADQSSKLLNVLSNDTIGEDDLAGATIEIMGQPDFGKVTVAPNGSGIIYTRTSFDKEATTDYFKYRVVLADGRHSSNTSVELALDAPTLPVINTVARPVVQQGDKITMDLSNRVNSYKAGNDVTLDVLKGTSVKGGSVSIVGQSLVFSADKEFTGIGSVTIIPEDDRGLTGTPVTITFAVYASAPASEESEVADELEVGESVVIEIPTGATQYDVVAAPQHGTIAVPTLSGGSGARMSSAPIAGVLVYTPADGFVGTDSATIFFYNEDGTIAETRFFEFTVTDTEMTPPVIEEPEVPVVVVPGDEDPTTPGNGGPVVDIPSGNAPIIPIVDAPEGTIVDNTDNSIVITVVSAPADANSATNTNSATGANRTAVNNDRDRSEIAAPAQLEQTGFDGAAFTIVSLTLLAAGGALVVLRRRQETVTN